MAQVTPLGPAGPTEGGRDLLDLFDLDNFAAVVMAAGLAEMMRALDLAAVRALVTAGGRQRMM
jgi:hypothetical protein